FPDRHGHGAGPRARLGGMLGPLHLANRRGRLPEVARTQERLAFGPAAAPTIAGPWLRSKSGRPWFGVARRASACVHTKAEPVESSGECGAEPGGNAADDDASRAAAVHTRPTSGFARPDGRSPHLHNKGKSLDQSRPVAASIHGG